MKNNIFKSFYKTLLTLFKNSQENQDEMIKENEPYENIFIQAEEDIIDDDFDDEEILDLEDGIEELNLSIRAYTTLKRASIDSISQLLSINFSSLMKIRTMGIKSAHEIILKLFMAGHFSESLMLEVLGPFQNYESLNELEKRELAESYISNHNEKYFNERREIERRAEEERKKYREIERKKEEERKKRREQKRKKEIDEQFLILQDMIGLEEVKTQVEDLIIYYTMKKLKKQENMIRIPHMVFTGNPGTGKTTVAKIIANIYNCLGTIDENKVMITSRSDFCAGYAGQTAIKTTELFQSALGGVLFVDEAYSLFDNDSYGQEALDTLTGLMTKHEGKCCVIFAGYQDEINKMFDNSNMGLRERFPTFIHFQDFTNEELMAILMHISKKQNIVYSENAQAMLEDLIILKRESLGKSFSNARTIRNLLQEIITHQERRIYKKYQSDINIKDEELYKIEEEDIINLRNSIQVHLAERQSQKLRSIGF